MPSNNHNIMGILLQPKAAVSFGIGHHPVSVGVSVDRLTEAGVRLVRIQKHFENVAQEGGS